MCTRIKLLFLSCCHGSLNPANFSWMTVVSAMGQMFYSLSIAMGILVTFGSYMKKRCVEETGIKLNTGLRRKG